MIPAEMTAQVPIREPKIQENFLPQENLATGLYLDGSGEHIAITGYKGVTGSAARTMSAWIKTDKGDAAILNWGNNAAAQKWTFRTQTENGVSVRTVLK